MFRILQISLFAGVNLGHLSYFCVQGIVGKKKPNQNSYIQTYKF